MILAARHATGRELPPDQFNGGSETSSFLPSLGFEIERKGSVADPRREEKFPSRARKPKEHGVAHSERCQECKAAVLALLQQLLLGDDTVMILGCHDLTVYNPNAQAPASGSRQDVNTEFRALAAARRPAAVLHHPHTTTKCGTWEGKWRRLADELPFVREYLGTGAYSFRDPGWDQRDALARVLEVNGSGEILNVIVRLCGTS